MPWKTVSVPAAVLAAVRSSVLPAVLLPVLLPDAAAAAASGGGSRHSDVEKRREVSTLAVVEKELGWQRGEEGGGARASQGGGGWGGFSVRPTAGRLNEIRLSRRDWQRARRPGQEAPPERGRILITLLYPQGHVHTVAISSSLSFSRPLRRMPNTVRAPQSSCNNLYGAA